MVKVKICGITCLEDAICAVEAGADALGFVFYKSSPRYIPLEKAAAVIRALPSRVKKIGVFVNARLSTVERHAKMCGLDMIQLHGEESGRFCSRCRPLKVIKAIRVGRAFDKNILSRYEGCSFLFDSRVAGKPGGTGRTFDWKMLSFILKESRPSEVFLSGGLNPGNVSRAVKTVRPEWVDISSSLESSPGKKDRRKITAFMNAVKRL